MGKKLSVREFMVHPFKHTDASDRVGAGTWNAAVDKINELEKLLACVRCDGQGTPTDVLVGNAWLPVANFQKVVDMEARVAALEQQLIGRDNKIASGINNIHAILEMLGVNHPLDDLPSNTTVEAAKIKQKRIAELEHSNTLATKEMTRLQKNVIDLVCPACKHDCKGNVTCSKLGLNKIPESEKKESDR